MGVFDEIRCKYPLPIKGANDLLFQTKDTPNQWMDLFEIREDGTLWEEKYDIEDQSDPAAEGLERLIGCMTRVNQRWVQLDFSGWIGFYGFLDQERTKWVECKAEFIGGKLVDLKYILE